MENDELEQGTPITKDLNSDKTGDTPKKMRQVIIETDGDMIKVEKAEVSGKIELIAILQSVIGFINNQK